ncbi:hypothetical protein SprV_0200755700 [Sparganum proliferum]
MLARVTNNDAISVAFVVTSRVEQDYVLAPTLFSLMFSAMLMDAYRDKRLGIRITYRTDGHFLNESRVKVLTRLFTTTVHDLLFVDDCALNTTTEVDMQRSIDLVVAGCVKFVLAINTDKTVVMQQPSSNAEYNPPRISVSDNQVQTADNFVYLGSTLAQNANINDEVVRRLSKASQAFGRLQASAWNRHRHQLNTRLKIYKAVVLTTLLYGAETWTVYASHARKRNHLHLNCLLRML